jgi:hypothetical protein
MIGDALKYPFVGAGRYMLLIGAVLSLLSSLASYVPFLGLIIAIAASGYFAAYMFKIINSTACGQDEPCDWPEFQNFFDDLLMPWLCMVSATFFSFAPYGLVSITTDDSSVLTGALFVLGFVHLPMAILCVALFGTLRSAFWATTLPGILSCLPQYFVPVLFIGGLYTLRSFLNNVLGNIPILGWFVSFFLGMYSLMVLGRVVGLFVRENQFLIKSR